MGFWKPYVSENKSGFQINVNMPRHLRPHVLVDGFRTEGVARHWLATDVAAATVERVVEHYKKVSGDGPFI